jgi:two-component system, chemotaxis family, protein-glutamate methylesterase/glutaminase
LPLRDVIVIGGSAGSVDALRAIVGGFPPDFPASVFVVIHLSADFPSHLDRLLTRWGPLPATQAVDDEPIQKAHIYVARPDHHLLVEAGKVRVLRGPRENRHRPAIDALFRTAAREFGPRVIGIVLSGIQDDGAAGLYAVKQRGGIAMVQDPEDALWGEMPNSALQYAHPQYVLRTWDIAPHIVKLVNQSLDETAMTKRKSAKSAKASLELAGRSRPGDEPEENIEAAYSDQGEGKPSVFACPECHGVLWELKEGKIVRFRCRVGHSYTTDSLAIELSQSSETALWAAMRALEEKAAMQRRVADSLNGDRPSARRLRDQSIADEANARVIRDMIFQRDARLGGVESHSGTSAQKEDRLENFA